MKIPEMTIPLKCLFCGSELEGPTDAKFNAGDLIKCLKCGEDNDYESVLEVAKEKGIEMAKIIMHNELKKMFK